MRYGFLRACLGAAALSIIAAASLPAQLQIHFLDVGQGDAALIITPTGRAVLIDAGHNPSFVAGILRASHIDTLDLVVASHNHADHIGGMSTVLQSTTVRAYVDNRIPTSIPVYARMARTLIRRKVPVMAPTSRTLTVGGVRFMILAPPPSVEGQEEQNNWSVGVLVEYGAFHALFTGDSEIQELAYWLEHESLPRVQVLKVAHHGSTNGTSGPWVAATHPVVAVVSVGAHNTYHHPADTALSQWRSVVARIYRTDQDGWVDIAADSLGTFAVTTAATPGCTVRYSATARIRVEGGAHVLCR